MSKLNDLFLIYIMNKLEEDVKMLDSPFECNICLDIASEPMLTTCGHLYCWPCIYSVYGNFYFL